MKRCTICKEVYDDSFKWCWKCEKFSLVDTDEPFSAGASFSEESIASLSAIRKGFFMSYVHELMMEASKGKGKPVNNKSLGGDVELAIKAFQLFHISIFIAERKYVSPERVKDAVLHLYSKVWGANIDNCYKWQARYGYGEANFNYFTQLARFTQDIAKYITNSTNVLVEASLCVPSAAVLIGMTRVAVANAFNDNATVKELNANMQQFVNDITKEYISRVKNAMGSNDKTHR